MRRAIIAAVTLGLALALIAARPEAATQGQGRGGGGGNGGGGTTCPYGPFTATLSFDTHPLGGQTIFATWAEVDFFAGNVAGEVQNGPSFPVTFDLSDPSPENHYPELHAGITGIDFTAVAVDPYISTGDVLYEAGLGIDCDMLGMQADDATPYTMRLSFRWYEYEGWPVTFDDDRSPQVQWFLRYKPFVLADEQLTHVNAVRTSANEWRLWTRDDSIPPHFASLERSASGKGKNKIPRDDSRPSMPFELFITVDCGGVNCQTPG